MSTRSMPFNEDAERGLLCSFLLDPTIIDQCGNLDPEAWWHPLHGAVYEAIMTLRNTGKVIDFIAVCTEGARQENGAIITDQAAAISELFTFLPSAGNWEYYRLLVLEAWQKRQIIQELNGLIAKAYESTAATDDVESLMNEVEGALLRLRLASKADQALMHLRTHLKNAVTSLENAVKLKGATTGFATGLLDLDRMTSGCKPGQLWIIAGRPSMGKTVIGMQLALAFAKSQIPVAFFSLEMTGDELAERILGSEASVDLQRWRDGFMKTTDSMKLLRSANELSACPLFLDETPGLSVFDFRSRARRAVIKHGVKAIVVDYLQLMTSPSRRAQQSRAMEVAEISMALKAAAKELHVPVIAMAQLNRDADGKERRPGLSNLRESGQIEQDADVVCMIHRPHKDDRELDRTNGEPAELIIAKQRNGPVGVVHLNFRGGYTRFENVTQDQYSNNTDRHQRTDSKPV